MTPTDLTPLQELAVALFLVVSGVFGLVGSFGLIKLRDPLQRIHAPTKTTTLGVGGVLIASMLHAIFARGTLSFHELLITLFMFLTAPVSANFIAKTFMAQHLGPNDLPPTGRAHGWAIHDDPPQMKTAKTEPEETRNTDAAEDLR